MWAVDMSSCGCWPTGMRQYTARGRGLYVVNSFGDILVSRTLPSAYAVGQCFIQLTETEIDKISGKNNPDLNLKLKLVN